MESIFSGCSTSVDGGALVDHDAREAQWILLFIILRDMVSRSLGT